MVRIRVREKIAAAAFVGRIDRTAIFALRVAMTEKSTMARNEECPLSRFCYLLRSPAKGKRIQRKGYHQHHLHNEEGAYEKCLNIATYPSRTRHLNPLLIPSQYVHYLWKPGSIRIYPVLDTPYPYLKIWQRHRMNTYITTFTNPASAYKVRCIHHITALVYAVQRPGPTVSGSHRTV